MAQRSILDARLAEIDRRLSTIQTGLRAPERPSSPARRRPEPASAEREAASADRLVAPVALQTVTPRDRGTTDDSSTVATVVRELRELSAAHERLLELHGELLSDQAERLARSAQQTSSVFVDAGPFASAAAVRAFEQSLRALPGVAGVAVREYRGRDRVVVDVELAAG